MLLPVLHAKARAKGWQSGSAPDRPVKPAEIVQSFEVAATKKTTYLLNQGCTVFPHLVHDGHGRSLPGHAWIF